MLPVTEIILAALAAIAAGFVNSLAGGGTLISFPVLVSLGLSGVAADLNSAIALCPGYLGGAIAQKRDLVGQGRRLAVLVPAGIIGGIAGAVLLVLLTPGTFRTIVPFLLLLASGLVAVQDRVRGWVEGRSARAASPAAGESHPVVPVGIAAVYGGYFGAGLSVILLAVLGLFYDESLARLNALKLCLSLCVNVAAAVFFLFSPLVAWPLVGVMAAGALAGGAAGGRLASRADPVMVRWTVVAIGVAAAVIFLLLP